MNILIDRLPEAVTVAGGAYAIRTDFRVWIRFELLMFDGSLSMEEKAIEFLGLCYENALPPTLDEAIGAMIDFYSGGKREAQGEAEDEGASKSPIYSFEHDQEHIYAAFLAQYGIDLQAVKLHWWQFKALFKSLNDTNQIVKIMEYRSVDLSKIKDKEQKSFYQKMKMLYRIPDLRSEEEKEKAIAHQLGKLF